MTSMVEKVQECAVRTRRNVADLLAGAEEAEGRANELRSLVAVAGPGKDATRWEKEALFFDSVAVAHRAQAEEFRRWLDGLPQNASGPRA